MFNKIHVRFLSLLVLFFLVSYAIASGIPFRQWETGTSLTLPVDEFQESSPGRSDEYHDVNIYLKGDLSMDTQAPTNNTASITRLADGESVEFATSRSLYGDLPVKGMTDGDKNGFKLFLRTIYAGNTESSVTIKIYDGDIEVASSTFFDRDPWPDQKIIFYNKDVAPQNLYTFQQGNHIRIKVNASVKEGPLSGTVAISYDGQREPTNSRLSLFTNQIASVEHDTYRDDVKTESFEPNLPDGKRYLDVNGEIEDIMGDYDISSVDILVYDPEMNEVGNASAELDRGTEDAAVSFRARWEYDSGNPAGRYTIKVTITDNSMNEMNSTLQFDMANYGVMITSSEYEKSGMADSHITFTITVRNTGGLDDTYAFDCTVYPSFWDCTMEDGVSVSAGSEVQTELRIKVPSNSNEGDLATVELSAVSESEPGISGTLPEPITVTAITEYMFTVELNDEAEQAVDNGKTVLYGFTVSNVGDKDDSIIMEVPQAEVDWNVEVSGDVVRTSPEGIYPESYQVEMEKNDEKELTVEITAPETPTNNVRNVLDIVFTSANESLMSLSFTLITTTPTSIQEQLVFKEGITEATSEYDGSTKTFETVSFKIVIENPGNSEWRVDLDVEIEDEALDWFVEWPVSVSLPPNAEKMISVEITPSSDALASDIGLEFVVNGKIRGREGASAGASRSLYVKVGQYFSIGLNLKGDSEKTVRNDGSSVSFQVEVRNTGNGRDTISLRSKDDSGWRISISDEEVSLMPGGRKTITVTVTASDGIKDGDVKKIIIEASTGEKVSRQVSLKVYVEIGLKEHFSELIRDKIVWIIMAMFLVVVYLFIRTMRTLGKR